MGSEQIMVDYLNTESDENGADEEAHRMRRFERQQSVETNHLLFM